MVETEKSSGGKDKIGKTLRKERKDKR